jgi:hypothetical protein
MMILLLHLRPSRQIIFPLCNDRFLPNPFQLIIHLLPYCSTLHSLADSVVKQHTQTHQQSSPFKWYRVRNFYSTVLFYNLVRYVTFFYVRMQINSYSILFYFVSPYSSNITDLGEIFTKAV